MSSNIYIFHYILSTIVSSSDPIIPLNHYMFPIYSTQLSEHKVDTVPSTTWYLGIMMMCVRAEILLVLIVCAIVFLQPPVMGKFPTCTATQKREILMQCRLFILEAESSVPYVCIILVLYGCPCCEAVRAVPNRNMHEMCRRSTFRS